MPEIIQGAAAGGISAWYVERKTKRQRRDAECAEKRRDRERRGRDGKRRKETERDGKRRKETERDGKEEHRGHRVHRERQRRTTQEPRRVFARAVIERTN